MHDATQYVSNNAAADKLKAIKLRMFAARDLLRERRGFSIAQLVVTLILVPPPPLPQTRRPLIVYMSVGYNNRSYC